MKFLKHGLMVGLFAIFAIVSKYESRIIGNNPFNVGLACSVIYIGTTLAEREQIGEEFNNADIPVDLTGVTTLAGLRNATATAVRDFATAHGFTVPANAVLLQTYQAN